MNDNLPNVNALIIRDAIKNLLRALEDLLPLAEQLDVVDPDAAARLREQLRAIETGGLS